MENGVLKIIKWTIDTFSGARLRQFSIDKGGLWVEVVGFWNTKGEEGSWWKIFFQPSNNYKKIKFKIQKKL